MSPAFSTFVLVIHSLLAIALVAVILMQRSEGGALGIGGGGPGGLMSARGAGNLLTKATGWLAAIFIGTSLLLAIIAGQGRDVSAIDTSLADDAPLAPSLADDIAGDVEEDPALVTPTQDLDEVPFAIPGAERDPADEDVPLAE